jgi:hypothetical protein
VICISGGMKIRTTNDQLPDAKPAPAIEPPVTGKIQPALGDPHASAAPDLESRIRLRRAELFVRLRELRADRRLEAADARDRVKAKLSELTHLLKWGISDGWDSLGEAVKRRLEHWLRESGHQLPMHDRPDKTAAGQ